MCHFSTFGSLYFYVLGRSEVVLGSKTLTTTVLDYSHLLLVYVPPMFTMYHTDTNTDLTLDFTDPDINIDSCFALNL